MSQTSTGLINRNTTNVVGSRIAAQVIDIVAMFIQVIIVGFILAYLLQPEQAESVRGFVAVGFLTLPLYGGLLEGYWNGQTFGKRLLTIKVVTQRGNAPSVGQAFLRNLPAVLLFGWLPVVVALASIAMTDDRQRVFDRVAGTYVVNSYSV